MAGWGSHEHRSGPAHNAAWLPVFSLLEVERHALGTATASSSSSSSASSLPSSPVASASERRRAAVSALAGLRDAWASRAHALGRAARHYERAAQMLTAQCIATAPVNPPTPIADATAAAAVKAGGTWVVATAPVRIDLAGGWSDTPPITFEATVDGKIVQPGSPRFSGVGGAFPISPTKMALDAAEPSAPSSPVKLAPAPAAPPSPIAPPAASNESLLDQVAACANGGGGLVINAAVTVDGSRPLGSRARVTPCDGKSSITIRTRALPDAAGDTHTAANLSPRARASEAEAPGVMVASLTLHSPSELADYNQPHAGGALVKCALLLLGIVRLDGAGDGLSLFSSVAGGSGPRSLEVETWSLIPHGSGLGGSSILATCVLRVICLSATTFSTIHPCRCVLMALCTAVRGVILDRASLVHLTLRLEQMLTTGGGWQDQVELRFGCKFNRTS